VNRTEFLKGDEGMDKLILDYLKHEKECLIRLIGDNKNEFNSGRLYAMEKMIDGVEGVLLSDRGSNIPIESLGLSVRSYNCLKRNGVDTIDELLEKTMDDFMRMKNLNRKSLHEIEMKIAEIE